MSMTIPTEAAVMSDEQSDIVSQRIWFEPINLTEPVNELPDGFAIARGLRKRLMEPLSATELSTLDPFSTLRRISNQERQRTIRAYWEKNNHVRVPETIVNILLFTLIMWTMSFLMALGLLLLWD